MRDLTSLIKIIVTPRGENSWKIQFVQHLFSGAIATVAHYVVMWVALSLQLWPVLATTIGFSAGATTRFLFSYFHIFEPERNITATLPHFIMALLLQMTLNAGLLALFLIFTDMVWWAQIATTLLLTVFNFLVYKFWVFK